MYVATRAAQIFQKSRTYFKILGASRVTRSKLHSEDKKILGAKVTNIFITATWLLGYEHL
jgi:hypothetical protein